MKFKNFKFTKKNNGFTILESLIYIYITIIVFMGGVTLSVEVLRSYSEIRQMSINYNEYNNFFISLDNIVKTGEFDNIAIKNNEIIFSKTIGFYEKSKTIKFYDGKIFVKYIENGKTKTINTMLENVKDFEIEKKKKLIYFIIHDKEGEEFIKCI